MSELAGRTIGVTADRRGEDQVVMFTRLGADVVLGPTISTVKVPDPDLLRQRTDDLIAEPPDYVIANTGIGMRTWIEYADKWGRGEALREALGRVRLVTRGPKASAALSSNDLESWFRSESEQLAGVVEHLLNTGVQGKRVAFQLHGDDGAEVAGKLAAAGATVTTIPVYVWRLPTDPAPAIGLIDRTCEGQIDALTFTAGPQVRSMFELAGPRQGELRTVLNSGRVVSGCIGPVCAGVAIECGIADPVVPNAWRLGSLVKAVSEALRG